MTPPPKQPLGHPPDAHASPAGGMAYVDRRTRTQGLTVEQIKALIDDAVAERLQAVAERLDRGGERMDRIEATLERNTKMTEEVIEVLHAGRSGLRVLGWLGEGLKWVIGLGASVAALYVTLKGGKP